MTFRNRVAWLAIGMALIWVAWLSLKRVESGELFLIPLPIDPLRPFDGEVADALKTTRLWNVPALAFLAVASLAILFSVRLGPIDAIDALCLRCRQLADARTGLCLLLLIACIADFVSTASYFRKFGITDEYHPAIKLITYAWGRFIGCLIAKTIQGFLVLVICALFPSIARATLLLAITAYTAAAIWNFWVQ